MSMLLIPFVMIAVAAMLLFFTVGSSFSSVLNGGVSKYDEIKFQEYADAQYADAFGDTDDYEDNLLIVFLVEDEKYYDYSFIAWVGDDISPKIGNMFGDETTKFGRAIQSSAINSDTYKFALSSGIASVINTMEDHISDLGLDSSFVCGNSKHEFDSHLVNNTSINITESTVNRSLESFTDSTGIPVVVIVEDIEEVFPKSIDTFDIIIVIVSIALIILAIFLIVKAIKASKEKKNDDGSYKGSSQQSEKIDFDNF